MQLKNSIISATIIVVVGSSWERLMLWAEYLPGQVTAPWPADEDASKIPNSLTSQPLDWPPPVPF